MDKRSQKIIKKLNFLLKVAQNKSTIIIDLNELESLINPDKFDFKIQKIDNVNIEK
jgi:hypothetical protein